MLCDELVLVHAEMRRSTTGHWLGFSHSGVSLASGLLCCAAFLPKNFIFKYILWGHHHHGAMWWSMATGSKLFQEPPTDPTSLIVYHCGNSLFSARAFSCALAPLWLSGESFLFQLFLVCIRLCGESEFCCYSSGKAGGVKKD